MRKRHLKDAEMFVDSDNHVNMAVAQKDDEESENEDAYEIWISWLQTTN